MDSAWISLFSGLVGAVAGAFATRTLADKSEGAKQVRQAYADWLTAVLLYRAMMSREDATTGQATEHIQALHAASWVVRLVEPDEERWRDVDEITKGALRGQPSQDLESKMNALIA